MGAVDITTSREARHGSASKQITVHAQHAESAPVIYLPVVMGDGAEVYERCRELNCPPFTLVGIGSLNWNRELSPWGCDGTVRDAEPFGGQASGFLDELLNWIIPEAESSLPQPPTWRGIAGYSLAGLFALWSLWQTDAFSRAASASGSLWFPDFVDRASTAPFAGNPQAVYLSLGKKETKTPNRMMRHVLDDTRAMEALLVARGIPTTLELNPGNHFAQTDLRMARGIHWILTH